MPNLSMLERDRPPQAKALFWIMSVSAVILFISSSARHALFQSNTWDLGIFDQAVYLISQGQTPISSFLGFHILGDHAAVILYPLALLYKLYPAVHWLLLVQAIALASGSLLTWHLARQAKLPSGQAMAVVFVYLLYPLVFNSNLFDFHPDVIAVPALLAAVLAARSCKTVWFCVAVGLALSCKAVLALTVACMGIWLLVFEQRRLYGIIALSAGLAWFIVATQGIIPGMGGPAAAIGRHLSRYSSLGGSFPEIASNLVLKPWLLLGHVFTLANLEYLVLLLAPVIWGLSIWTLTPLVPVIPQFAMNLLAQVHAQKDLVHQYSLPILPFLLLAIIATLAAGKGWVQGKRGIILWSLVGFLCLAKASYLGTRYLAFVDTWQATREAIAQVPTHSGSVLTSSEIAAHLAQRSLVKLAIAGFNPATLPTFDYVLLNVRHPGWLSSPEFAGSLVKQLQANPGFESRYQRDDVYLFVKKTTP